MDALAIALVAAAFVAGLTGTWSPCGFSMIETIGPVGHSGGRATTLSACVTFSFARWPEARSPSAPWLSRVSSSTVPGAGSPSALRR